MVFTLLEHRVVASFQYAFICRQLYHSSEWKQYIINVYILIFVYPHNDFPFPNSIWSGKFVVYGQLLAPNELLFSYWKYVDV